jgi:hypothetical protein
MSAAVRMPVCPGCSKPPRFLMGGGTQAFCGTDTCRVMTWDPTGDPATFWDDAVEMEITAPPVKPEGTTP